MSEDPLTSISRTFSFDKAQPLSYQLLSEILSDPVIRNNQTSGKPDKIICNCLSIIDLSRGETRKSVVFYSSESKNEVKYSFIEESGGQFTVGKTSTLNFESVVDEAHFRAIS